MKALKDINRSLLEQRVVGFVLMTGSIYLLSFDLLHRRGLLTEHLFKGGLFFLGISVFFGTFKRSWIRRFATIMAIAGLLFLIGMDVVRWRQGEQSLTSVVIVWGVILPGVMLAAFLLARRQERSDASQQTSKTDWLEIFHWKL